MTASSQADNGSEGEVKSFLAHLEDLRATLLWSLGFLAAGMLAAIPLPPALLRLIMAPLAEAGVDPNAFLQVLKVTGGMAIALRLVFWAGLILAAPFIVFAAGRFVFPGLTRVERRTTLAAGGLAVVLFAAGVLLGYTVTLPVALRLMLRINAWLGIRCEFVELAHYVAFVMRLLLAFGLSFELPVVILALGRLGLVTSDTLRQKRRYVIVGLLTAAMILTPPDPFTQLLMAAPLILLYEACIWMIWLSERRSTAAGAP